MRHQTCGLCKHTTPSQKDFGGILIYLQHMKPAAPINRFLNMWTPGGQDPRSGWFMFPWYHFWVWRWSIRWPPKARMVTGLITEFNPKGSPPEVYDFSSIFQRDKRTLSPGPSGSRMLTSLFCSNQCRTPPTQRTLVHCEGEWVVRALSLIHI